MSEAVLERLKQGIRRFQSGEYTENAAEYQRLGSTRQQPHSLIIACGDSRVDVEKITSSGPGEVFVARNIGNMVPAYGEAAGGGVDAVIEYAVSALGVQHIVICGHSDCGAMKALLDPGSAAAMPAVANWLAYGQGALRKSESLAQPDESPIARLRRLTEENVLMQLANLRTHPSVAAASARGELTLSSWVYEIATGNVRVAEDPCRTFNEVAEASA